MRPGITGWLAIVSIGLAIAVLGTLFLSLVGVAIENWMFVGIWGGGTAYCWYRW